MLTIGSASHTNDGFRSSAHPTQLLFDKGSAAGVNTAHKSKLIMRLVALDTASTIEDMNLPSFRLHSLKGNKEGLWAIDVNKNWRITFEFREGDAYILDYEDYH